jgi:hypothetical protein
LFNNLKSGQEQQKRVHFAPQQQQQQVPNKFSQQYASFIGAKPRAQASAKIKLGGLF